MGLFDDKTEAAILRAYEEAKRSDREESRGKLNVVAQYIVGDMYDDVIDLLTLRYSKSMRGGFQQKIHPAPLPLFKAYLEEFADVYSGGITRRITNEDGDQNDELTKIYNDGLKEMEFDENMIQVEQGALGMHSMGVLPQLTPDKKLDMQLYAPQDVYAVPPPDDGSYFNPIDQGTYHGFDLDVRMHEKTETGTRRRYVFVQAGGHTVYFGKHPGDITESQAPIPHGLTWKGKPLNMFTLWHAQKPTQKLMYFHEHPLFIDNQELNVLWSWLNDVVRFQGAGTPVRQLTTSEGLMAEQPVGVRFPVINESGETFDYAIASVDWIGLVGVISAFVKTASVMNNLSPNTFSIEQEKALSGVAKIVENLPKDRERRKRIRWFKKLEQRLAYPRIAAMLAKRGEGALSAWEAHRLDVTFKGTEIPLSVDEQAKKDEHEIKIGLTTPAKLLAERKGITVEEAQAEIEENLEQTAEIRAAGQQGMGQPQGGFGGFQQRRQGGFADLIRGTNGQDNRQAPRRDRPPRGNEDQGPGRR